MVVNDGYVVEEGTHAELTNLGGAYKKLVDRQMVPAHSVIGDSQQVSS